MLHHAEELHLRSACIAAERGPFRGTPTAFSTRFAVRAACLALSASVTLGALESVATLAEGPESDTPIVVMPSVEITAPAPATPPTPSAY